MYSNSAIEYDLVQAINRRIIFGLSISIIKEKPEGVSYNEYCNQLREVTTKKLEENDPHGILVEHQKHSILEGIKELLIPVTSSFHASQEENNTQIDSQTLLDFHGECEKQNNFYGPGTSGTHYNGTNKLDIFTFGNTDNQHDDFTETGSTIQGRKTQCFDSGIQSDQDFEIQTSEPQPLPQGTELRQDDTVVAFQDAYKSPLKTTEISSDIDFLKTILNLKGLLRSGAAIPLSDLTNVLQPGETHSTEDDQFSTISPHLLEYKLHQLNSDKLIETLYIRILDFFQENLFSKLEKDMQILMEYKGSDLQMLINCMLDEVIPLCPKYYDTLLSQFIRKQITAFYIECRLTSYSKRDVLEQIENLLLEFCRTKTILNYTIDFIIDSLVKLARTLKSLPSIDHIANIENSILLYRLMNTSYLQSLARRCIKRLNLSEHDEKMRKVVQIWKRKHNKVLLLLKDYLYLYVIESQDLFKT